jgi:SAM-dependent methyltransferase
MQRGDHDEIADFYGRHPYPPPIADLDRYRRAWTTERNRVEDIRLWPTRPAREDRTILIAGCGTSQAAKYAIRYPGARVVGIDVSSTSIDETCRLAVQHGLENLEVHRLPIEQVGQLGERFDQIVSTGVLHHLADPAVGLTALAAVLADSGALDAMLYAPFGRTGVYMIQEYCRLLGVGPAPREIEDLIATLRELPLGHPLGHLLRTTPDFADDDALADALLNPRDQAYSVPDVFALLDAAGLRFGRWTRQAPYLPQCGSMRQLPHRERIAALPVVEQYAAMELFRGTMVRHSFIARRADEPPVQIQFDDDAWRRLVPVRTSTSIAVTERVPEGVAAALLNQAHNDPDLVLFATDEQHRGFEMIDGRRSFAEIGDDAAFFERLWQHDLIVVDASDA